MLKSYVALTIKDKILFRIFPAFGLVVSLLSIILPPWFNPLGNVVIHNEVIYQLIHMASSVLFILILIFPGNYVFFAIIGLMFSLYLPLEQADVFYSFLYYSLFLFALYEMNLFEKRTKLKIFGVCVFYIFIIFIQFLFYGFDFFLSNVFQHLVTFSVIVIAAVLVFSVEKISKAQDYSREHFESRGKALDLETFERFSDREIIIICKILCNEKYDYIARQLGLSEITVKKAAGNIFRKMDCTDKFDFFGKYSNLAVCEGERVFLTEKREETELLLELMVKEKK